MKTKEYKMFNVDLLPAKRCNVCIDPKKDCKGDCNCKNCKCEVECNKRLKPTIRITTKCTQKCNHCCFRCSPESNDMMTMENAIKINKFLKANKIISANIMGGEFYCNPDWYDIIDTLVDGVEYYVRLTTNGDWAGNKQITKKVLELVDKNKQIYFVVSKDKWHTNKNVSAAEEILKENDKHYIIGTMEEDAIVPVGNGVFYYSAYSSFQCACRNPEKKYMFLIDEVGTIYKCGFGIWNYDEVDDYLDGGFDERFKQFNTDFYKVWLGNCSICVRGYNNCKKDLKIK